MKLSTSALLLSSVGLVLGSDTDGTVTVKETCDKSLEVSCEWEASARRRLLRGGANVVKDRALSMELEAIDCTLTYGEDEYFSPLRFPYDFMVEVREADDQDEFCVYTATGIVFDGIDVTATLTVELKEVDGDAVYDDETLSISGCPSVTRI